MSDVFLKDSRECALRLNYAKLTNRTREKDTPGKLWEVLYKLLMLIRKRQREEQS